MRTQLKFSTAYHPKTDDLAERMIQILEDMIRRYSILEKSYNSKIPIHSLKQDLLHIHPTASSFKTMIDKSRAYAQNCIREAAYYNKQRWDKTHKEKYFHIGDKRKNLVQGLISYRNRESDVTIEQLGQQLNSSYTEGKKTAKHDSASSKIIGKRHTILPGLREEEEIKWNIISNWERDKDILKRRSLQRFPRTTTRKTREIQFRTVEYEEEGSRYNMKPIGKEDKTTCEVKDEVGEIMR
ncbi:hypothetical protein PPACK8108_LOCUS17793 [Phakopsora pachyrhizi]|uniref:Uncharacterized protein n=1 Tax=Phakopsora pachyrhizi TaxID=170000 RepID=A0AAV0BA81_PHAPC|nr:hypothetical protein PPACK8108_LOCUS17793 [Phakopsora pachyrhizi]